MSVVSNIPPLKVSSILNLFEGEFFVALREDFFQLKNFLLYEMGYINNIFARTTGEFEKIIPLKGKSMLHSTW